MKTTQVISFGLLMAPLFVRASLADGVKQSSIPPHIDISSSCAKELNSTKINFVLRKVPQIITDESTDFRDISQAGNDDPEIEEMFLKHMARLSPGTLARVVDRIAQVANLQEPSEEIAI
ncbi:hypothetical protein BIW11_12121 [Tropilaelaps mercedesae]|uniref:Uncharacterized protein n=1 Tax=Tropilaelaps mercedesae TaxID=418985 RepID=A0A1V9X803_9ACAR|nr:hypothetical protein BIW11_12121 [Tropilaelaps mercedesae]